MLWMPGLSIVAFCPNPEFPANGQVLITGNSLGDQAVFKCSPGFELIGSHVATCTRVGDVSAMFLPGRAICTRKFSGYSEFPLV